MKTNTKHALYTLGLLLVVGLGTVTISSALRTPLLHIGAQSQILSKFSVGTPSIGSLFTVKNADNDATLKILPDNPGEKSLLIHNNSLLLGSIRVGNGFNSVSDFSAGATDQDFADVFGVGVNQGNWEDSVQYPTSKNVAGNIQSVAPKQSINVHGDIVLEGVKAPTPSAESAQLCIAPNGTISRCSAPTGYKWVATGFSGCLDDQSAITNTIGSLADYQNPQCLISVGIGGGSIGEPVSTTGSATVGFNSIKDAVAPKKAFATLINPSGGGTLQDLEVLCNPSTPYDGSGGGYGGKKVQGFECKSLNSCDVVADSFCTDSVGAKPTYEASCSTSNGDVGPYCVDGCHIGANNLCYVDTTSPTDPTPDSCVPVSNISNAFNCNFDTYTDAVPFCNAFITEGICEPKYCCTWGQ